MNEKKAPTQPDAPKRLFCLKFKAASKRRLFCGVVVVGIECHDTKRSLLHKYPNIAAISLTLS